MSFGKALRGSLLAQAELFLKDNRNVLSPPTTDDRGLWLSSRTEAWAARYGDSWDKVATLMDASRAYAYRLRRNARLLSILLGVVALLIIGALCGGLIVYRNVTQALDELYAEQAKVIWSEIGSSSDTYFLTPRQRNAFWQVAGSEPRVREKFVGWLSEDPDLAARFGTYAAIISRAIGLGWPQTAEQAQAALGHVLDAFGKTSGLDALGALARAAQALAPKLTPEQAQVALGRVLDAMGETADPGRVEALAPAVLALVLKLTPEQAQAALGRVLDAFGITSGLDALGALAQAVQALAPKLTAEQAQAALGRVLDAIGKTTDSHQLGALAQVVQALSPKLRAGQAEAALGRVVDAIGKTTDSDPLGAPRVVQALAPKLTAEQAQAALGRVLDAIGETFYSDALGALAQAVQALAPKLTAEQAQAALGRVLDAIGKTTGSDALGALTQAVQALAPKLTAEQAEQAIARVLSALGWSSSSAEAQQWAKELAALLERLPDSKPASRVLTEAVKFPVAAGEPTDELLAALQKYLPSLPGPTAGLLENLDWLKQNEPSIDLTSRAVCPPPPREELHCP